MPVFLRDLLRWIRQHPLATALGVGLLGLITYWQLQPAPPPAAQPAATPTPFAGIVPPTATLEKALAALQRDNEQLRQQLEAQAQTLEALQRQQDGQAAARQQRLAAQERRVEAALEQALAAAQTAPAAPPPPVMPPPTPQPRLRILRPKTPPKAPTKPPPPPPPAWGRLRPGSFATGRLLTGVFATIRRQGALPVLLALETPFGGPDRAAVPLSGCLAIGKAAADLASQRAVVQLVRLSCLLPDGTTFERPITGYVTGADADVGIPGQRVLRTGAFLSNVALASLVAAGEAFSRTQGAARNTVVAQIGGASLQLSTKRLVDFFLDRAEEQIPAIWVRSGTLVRLVLQEGVTVEGLPATAAAPPRPSGID
jgi:hypothetical protein